MWVFEPAYHTHMNQPMNTKPSPEHIEDSSIPANSTTFRDGGDSEGCCRRVLIVGALPESLINFRGELIRSLNRTGYEVFALAAQADSATVAGIAALGATYVPYPVSRNSMNPIADLWTVISLIRVIWRLNPDAIYCYTIKPILYGGIALRLSGCRARFIALVTGLGYAFSGHSYLRRLLTFGISKMYRFALAKATKVVFQNADNRASFTNSRIVPFSKTMEIAGSGVSLTHFEFAAMPRIPVKILMAARLLKEKGVIEYCEAARLSRVSEPTLQFVLVGPVDPSPDSVPLKVIQEYVSDGSITYLGNAKDIRPHLRGCHIFALPSYHEGRARTIQEALAVGRPVITTDAPGCHDSIEKEVTGIVIPKGSAKALSDAVLRLARDPRNLLAMGQACREYAETRYDVERINISLINLLLEVPESTSN